MRWYVSELLARSTYDWTCTLMTLIGPACGFPISSDDGADPTSLDGIKGKTENTLYQTGVRTAEGCISKGKKDSGGNDTTTYR